MTAVITDADLEAAAARVAEARSYITGARHRGRGLHPDQVADVIARAVTAEQELLERHQAQQARLAARAEAEKAAAADLKRLARDVAKAHEATVAAVADGHLTGIVDAVAAFNAAVEAAHARLVELELPATDELVEHATGWAASLSARSVLLAGRRWTVLPLDVVVLRLVSRALGEHLGRQHPAVQWTASYRTGSAQAQAAQELLDELDTRAPAAA